MYMRSVLATAAVLSTLGALPASAGCYSNCVPVEPVATTYVKPARTVHVREPAVIGTRVQRIETQPGYWTATRQPAQVGIMSKSVVVQPAQVHHQTISAKYETVHETVVVRAASVRYEMRPDCCGRMVKCAVHVPAVTKTVARQVMVSPAHSVAHTTPAVYKTVTTPVTIAPAKTTYDYTPAKFDYVAHPMMLKGETFRAVHVPAEVVRVEPHSRWHRWH
jgi:hypothetical protein